MALQSGIPVSFEAYFPRGAFMVGEIEAVVKWSDDGQRQGQDLDKNEHCAISSSRANDASTSRVRMTVDAARSSRASALEVRVPVWIVKQRSDKEARPLSLGALAEAAARAGVAQLIIERDESLEHADRRLIADAVRHAGSSEMQYRHVTPHEHPLLWVTDAVAWCYSNGGDWIRRVDAIVESRVTRL